MACDICGESTLCPQQLYPEYQTDKIKDLCPKCMTVVNNHLWELRRMSNKMNQNFLKRFMENWRHKKEAGRATP